MSLQHVVPAARQAFDEHIERRKRMHQAAARVRAEQECRVQDRAEAERLKAHAQADTDAEIERRRQRLAVTYWTPEIKRVEAVLAERKKPSRIIAKVCEDYGISFDDLVGRTRIKGFAEVRQAAMYLLRAGTDLSLPEIGERLYRDHTTILHGCRAHALRHGLPDLATEMRAAKAPRPYVAILARLRAGEAVRKSEVDSRAYGAVSVAMRRRLEPGERIICRDGVLRLEVGL